MIKQCLMFLCAALLAVQAQANAPKPPDQVIQDATSNLQNLLREHHDEYKANNALFQKVVNDAVVPHFDLPQIAQLVLGRNWRNATPDQRTRFQNAFKNMLINAYASALLEYYDSVTVEWKPLRMPPNATDVTVNSLLKRPGKQPVAIGFAMSLVDNDWKIYDITILDVSLVTSYRDQFGAEIKKNGLENTIQGIESGKLGVKPEVKTGGG